MWFSEWALWPLTVPQIVHRNLVFPSSTNLSIYASSISLVNPAMMMCTRIQCLFQDSELPVLLVHMFVQLVFWRENLATMLAWIFKGLWKVDILQVVDCMSLPIEGLMAESAEWTTILADQVFFQHLPACNHSQSVQQPTNYLFWTLPKAPCYHSTIDLILISQSAKFCMSLLPASTNFN